MRNHQVADRYLTGKLTPEEVDQFEDRLIWCEQTRQELEVTERLRQGVIDSSSTSEPAKSSSLFASPRYAMAATLLMAFFAGTTGVLYYKQDLVTGPPQKTSVFSLIATRANPLGEPVNILSAGESSEWNVLLIDPGPGQYENYRVTLFREVGEPLGRVWQIDNLQPSFQGRLSIGVPGRQLTAGNYRAELEGLASEWVLINEITFRVESKPER